MTPAAINGLVNADFDAELRGNVDALADSLTEAVIHETFGDPTGPRHGRGTSQRGRSVRHQAYAAEPAKRRQLVLALLMIEVAIHGPSARGAAMAAVVPTALPRSAAAAA